MTQKMAISLTFVYGVAISTVFLSCLCYYSDALDIYRVKRENGAARRFDGIGGLSGGGATSKLLVNYPKEQRDAILDYLFKPLYGASLQILKVEIGGDAQSTDGTEASHMHYPWDENYQRGYEWWLMLEAKKRNPDILLYCLPWAFPAWIGNGTRSPYTNPQRTADYVIKFIQGGKKHYNLTFDFVGVWNERAYDVTYIKVLRKMLDQAGLKSIKIVAADGLWEPISADLSLDKDLASAVDIIGVHYPGTKGSEMADRTGKQLWSSEDYSTLNDNVGAGCWARILNQNYVNGNMTSTISWNLIASYYEALPFKRDGLMTADRPWSGYYKVEAPIWMTAHTTHFVYPGWLYFPHGSGVYKLKKGGSMVSLSSFDNTQFSIVIETMSHNHSVCIRPHLPAYTVEPQNITIDLNGSFSSVFKVNVWYSKLQFNGEPSTFMKNAGTLPVINGKVHLTLGVDEVYTLTTLGIPDTHNYPPIPEDKPFPLPYQDDFESYYIHQEPSNLAQQVGVYEVVKGEGSHSKVIQQKVLEYPVAWCDAEKVKSSLNLIGNSSWGDIYVESDTYIGPVNATSGVYVAARVVNGGCSSFKAEGIFFFLFPDKGSIEVTGDLARTQQLLEKKVTIEPHTWNNLGLLIKDGFMIGMLNGDIVFNQSLPAKTPSKGFVALGTANYGLADFDNFKIMQSNMGEKRVQLGQTDLLPKGSFYGPSFDDYSNFKGTNFFDVSKNNHKDDTLYFERHQQKHDLV